MHRTCKTRHLKKKSQQIVVFLIKKRKNQGKSWSFAWKIKNRPTCSDFEKKKSRPLTSQNFKTHKTFVVQRFLSYKYTSLHKLDTLLLSWDLKTKKVRHHPHPHPHPHPQNKTKIFGVKIEILIKYQWINWTLSRKAFYLLPGG